MKMPELFFILGSYPYSLENIYLVFPVSAYA